MENNPRPKNEKNDYFFPQKMSETNLLLLSILIPSLPERIHLLSSVLSDLHEQSKGKPVEVLVLTDNRHRTTGQKRNQLIGLAQGRFISFVDDDDSVAADYVDQILES